VIILKIIKKEGNSMKLITRLSDSDFLGGSPTFITNITRLSSRGILTDSQLNVAMMYMTKLDTYKLPGGGIEEVESKEEAFLREIKEETGYEAEITDELGYVEEHKNRNNFMQYSYCYIAKVKDFKMKNCEELTDYEKELGLKLQWMTIDKALRLMNNSLDNCNDYSMKFMILRDKTILEEGLKKLSRAGTIA
jgi:8-oxo-dGTP diphosphatase